MPYHLIANMMTATAILCGLVSIFSSIGGQVTQAAWLIIVAIIMDILDGKTARLLMPTDNFGKEFDSLADLISFGVAPVVLLYTTYNIPKSFLWVGLFFAYLMCAALRLARFNIHKSRNRYASFIGLPTTASAGFIAASVLFFSSTNMTVNPLYIKLGLLIFSILMVSIMPYPNSINIQGFLWLAAVVAFLITFIVNRPLSVWLVFTIYVILGPFFVLGRKTSEEFLPG